MNRKSRGPASRSHVVLGGLTLLSDFSAAGKGLSLLLDTMRRASMDAVLPPSPEESLSRPQPTTHPEGLYARIPASRTIFNSANLREYVEALQRQIDDPLEMIFDSEQIAEDYRSGEYMAGTKGRAV